MTLPDDVHLFLFFLALQDTNKVEIKNCQTWLREVVEALIEDEVFPPIALAVLDEAPKN